MAHRLPHDFPHSPSKSSASRPIAVRASSFWRTSEASLLPPPPLWTRKKASSTSARPPASWENWPTSGGMRNGCIYRRPTWVPAMGGNGGSASRGAWLTPHGMSGQEAETGRAGAGGEFAKQATNWASPRATDGDKGGPNCRGGRGDPILAGQACQWPTPDAGLYAGSNRSMSENAAVRPALIQAAATWPTPAARDSKGPNSEEHATVTGGGRKHMDQLANFVVYSPQAQQTRDGQASSPSGQNSRRRLNPIFAAWLMGWPSTWVIAEPHALSASATASYRHRLQQHLSCLLDELASREDAA